MIPLVIEMNQNINIYLDIDGVILANEHNLANGAEELIALLVDNHTVTWATTHCMQNDPETAVSRLQKLVQPITLARLKKIRGSSWFIDKTELFDFSKPFLWFDDDCFPGEKQKLLDYSCLQNWIEVDLYKDHNALLGLINNLPKPVQPIAPIAPELKS